MGTGGAGGGLTQRGGLINFLPLKRGGLLEGGGLICEGELNTGFTMMDFRYKKESTTVTNLATYQY